MSAFRGIDLFGSGPHRSVMLRRGVQTVFYADFNVGTPGTGPIGDLELAVVVRGRLVAATESALWTLRDAVTAETAFARGSGVLVDTRGRSFADVWFVRYEEFGTVDRGRVWSLAYEATFRRLSD